MKRKRTLMQLLVVGLFSFLIVTMFPPPQTAQACSCVPPESVQKELEKSDAVFRGVVTDMEKPAQFFGGSSGDLVEVTLEVEETWKGVETKEVIVQTAISSASCGFEFEVGKEYLVYARQTGEGLHVSLCSRTAAIEYATNDLDELEKGKTDFKEEVTKANPSQTGLQTSILIGTSSAAIIFLGVFIFRRQNK